MDGEGTPRLPTPCARDGKGPGHQYGLPDLVEPGGTRHGLLLPTPTAVTYGSSRSSSAGASRWAGLPQLAGRLLPTPTAGDSRSSANATAGRRSPLVGHAGRTLTDAARLLPTPRATDGSKGCPGQRGSHGDLTLPSAAVTLPGPLLPTPRASDARGPGGHGAGGLDLRTSIASGLSPGLPDAAGADTAGADTAGSDTAGREGARWGVYTPAVARWERLLGRPAPAPTHTGRHGRPVLAPAFVEWLMGLPEHWVTDPGLALPRTQALKVLGNGVVPQQATAALRVLLCPHWARGMD